MADEINRPADHVGVGGVLTGFNEMSVGHVERQERRLALSGARQKVDGVGHRAEGLGHHKLLVGAERRLDGSRVLDVDLDDVGNHAADARQRRVVARGRLHQVPDARAHAFQLFFQIAQQLATRAGSHELGALRLHPAQEFAVSAFGLLEFPSGRLAALLPGRDGSGDLLDFGGELRLLSAALGQILPALGRVVGKTPVLSAELIALRGDGAEFVVELRPFAGEVDGLGALVFHLRAEPAKHVLDLVDGGPALGELGLAGGYGALELVRLGPVASEFVAHHLEGGLGLCDLGLRRLLEVVEFRQALFVHADGVFRGLELARDADVFRLEFRDLLVGLDDRGLHLGQLGLHPLDCGAELPGLGVELGKLSSDGVALPGKFAIVMQGERHGKLALFVFEFLPAPGLSRLIFDGAHAFFDFVDDVAEPQEIGVDTLEFAQADLFLRLVLADARGLFEDCSAVLFVRREQDVHLALLDERIGIHPDPGVHEEVADVAKTTTLLVDVVFALAAAVEPPRDTDGLVVSGQHALCVGEGEGGFGIAGRAPGRGAVENDVLHLIATQGLDALFAKDPLDRVDDVALSTAIGPDKGRKPWLKEKFRLICKRLEAANLKLFQPHGRFLGIYMATKSMLCNVLRYAPGQGGRANTLPVPALAQYNKYRHGELKPLTLIPYAQSVVQQRGADRKISFQPGPVKQGIGKKPNLRWSRSVSNGDSGGQVGGPTEIAGGTARKHRNMRRAALTTAPQGDSLSPRLDRKSFEAVIVSPGTQVRK